MPLAITPVDYWQILSDMGFLSATSMSATYWDHADEHCVRSDGRGGA